MENTNNLTEHYNELETAFKMKKWIQLNESELETLIVICELNGIKQDIFDNLFKGVPHSSIYGQNVWQKINLLEKQKLIWVERDTENHVIHFHFHSDLKTELQQALPDLFLSVTNSNTFDTFKFSLRKETNRVLRKAPEYSGLFRLQKSVLLKEGQEYYYGGWVNDDGSIFVKILPVENNIMLNLEKDKHQEQSDSGSSDILEI